MHNGWGPSNRDISSYGRRVSELTAGRLLSTTFTNKLLHFLTHLRNQTVPTVSFRGIWLTEFGVCT